MTTVYGIINKEVTLEDFLRYKKDGFSTTQSNLKKYLGEPFEVIRSLTSEEVDIECAPMFLIKLQDGKEVHAFMEEIFHEDTLFNKLILTDKNLVRD